MAKKKRYLRFTGIDVGKNRHVFCIRDAQANIVQKPMGFPNSCHGFEKLVNCLKPFGRARSMLIGMEATGHYWQSLHDFLCEQGFCVVVINPIITATKHRTSIRRGKTDKRDSKKIFENLQMINAVLPPGWLPYGAGSAASGRAFPVAACIFGMALIGAASLRRSYKTTIRLYTGDFSKGGFGRRRKAQFIHKDSDKIKPPSVSKASFLEKKLPWMPEQASAVTVAVLRSLLRSIEVKMMMLTPAIMLIVFVGMLAGNRGEISGFLRPLSAIGLAAFMLIISMTGFVGNTFAFDRDGFRAFVLSGVPRREILLGKNLSFLPFAVLLMALIIGVSQWLNPMRLDHLAAVLIQIFPMYLLFCLAGNVLSILSPLTLKRGSGMPASHQGLRTLFQLVFMAVVPVPIGCTLLPMGIEALISAMGCLEGYPVFLTLGFIQVIFVFWLYRKILDREGILLQKYERNVLEVVCQKGE